MKTKPIWIFLLGISMAFSSCEQTEVSPAMEEISASQLALLSVTSSATADDSTPAKPNFGRKSRLTQVAVSSLPAAITTYIADHYAGASIEGAGQNHHGAYIVFIKNTDATYAALAFDAKGNFIAVNTRKATPLDPAHLPEAVKNYIATNYPNGTIQKAMKDAAGNFRVAIKNADGTFVGAAFSADGTFKQEISFTGKLGCQKTQRQHKKKGTHTRKAPSN